MKRDKKQRGNEWLRYSGMGFQMAITITLFALGGNWLDEQSDRQTPVWTIVGSLLGVAIAMYQVIRQVNKK